MRFIVVLSAKEMVFMSAGKKYKISSKTLFIKGTENNHIAFILSTSALAQQQKKKHKQIKPTIFNFALTGITENCHHLRIIDLSLCPSNF